MEKPFPAYDTATRYAKKADDDRKDNTQRFYDRMTVRGISVLRDDEGPDKPVWRGDHTFSSEAASYSLMNFIEPQIAAEHPDWSSSEVKKRARQAFEKRLAQDLSYERKEEKHIETTLEWRVVERADGTKELATSYGDTQVSLNELWEHTRQYAESVGNPAAYNEAEHKAQLRMQEEFIHGEASGFVSALSHPDSIRYVQVWEKQDGSVVSRQIDLFAATGRDFTFEEGTSFIQRLSERFGSRQDTGSTTAEYTHFFVERVWIDDGEVRFAAQSEVTSIARRTEKRLVGELEMRSALVHKKEHAEMRGYLSTVLPQAVDAAIRRVLPDVPHRQESPGRKPIRSAEKKREPAAKPPVPVPDAKYPAVTRKESGIPVIENPVLHVIAEWWVSKTVLRHSDVIPSGAHAAILWFTAGARPEDMPANRAPGLKEGMIDRKELMQTERVQSGFADVITRIREIVGSRKDPKNAVVARKAPESPSKSIAGELKDLFFKNIRPILERRPTEGNLPKEDESQPAFAVVRERKRILRLVDMIVRISEAVKLVQRPASADTQEPETLDVGVLPESAEAVAIPTTGELHLMRDHIVALLLLILTERNTEIPEMPGDDTAEPARVPEKAAPERRETPWLLFAIIWQLAMIREMGLSGQTPVPAATTTAAADDSVAAAPDTASAMPKHGIIFVYAS